MLDLLVAAAIMFSDAPAAPADSSTTVIYEDSTGFDCRVHGNRICGVGAVLPDGSLAIPGDYSNPNCWPGAIYCPPTGTPVDMTAGVEIS